MSNDQPPQADNAGSSAEERSRILARLQALKAERSNDSTRKFELDHDHVRPGYDGSLATLASTVSEENPHVNTRAYLLTVDGGVLAELPCREDVGTIALGRGQAAEIRVDDPYVHRFQAGIRWNVCEGVHYIVHGGGENSTFVDNYRIQNPFKLVGGEQLRFGKTTLLYRIRR
jgi:hypothetical protein